jgi:cation diffusion facilitator CzcD-associated flavoprotein CzcO
MPAIEGIESFQGDYWHTSHWPKEDQDFSDKRVGVIGCGATAIQLIPEVAKVAKHLTVFQRSPNYAAPLRNSLITEEEQREIKARYPEIMKKCEKHFAGFMYEPDPRSALEVSAEDREAFFEAIWAERGFKKWFGNFHDTMTDAAAAELMSEFVRNKIRERVDDPEVAELLCPKDHLFGTKRLPLESGYYEAFNRDNVTLKDVKSDPIEEITPDGLRTGKQEFELDVIIYATGFDAISGSLTRMDIRGEKGETIKEAWADGPRSLLGMQVAGFPNLFISNGAVFCNTPTCIAIQVDWVADCIQHVRENGHQRIEAKQEAEDAWVQHCADATEGMLFEKAEVASWFMGTNIPGKSRVFLLYAGGAPAYREACAKETESGYQGFELS